MGFSKPSYLRVYNSVSGMVTGGSTNTFLLLSPSLLVVSNIFPRLLNPTGVLLGYRVGGGGVTGYSQECGLQFLGPGRPPTGCHLGFLVQSPYLVEKRPSYVVSGGCSLTGRNLLTGLYQSPLSFVCDVFFIYKVSPFILLYFTGCLFNLPYSPLPWFSSPLFLR